ncbi:thioesterase II family protein [Streptosporangium saharense]|uniref:thioesterase II family protein n=1 Tax=Streptosporangium saharense TaxID=1706840 RepID=UPI0036B6A2A4
MRPYDATDRDRWIRQLRGGQGRLLICFPHAGGSATAYRTFAQVVTGDVEVVGVQYPGRQDRRTEPPPSSVTALADDVAAVLNGWLDRPYALFGHSMGATLAYEVACRLEGAGDAPVRLFVSGRRAPSWRRDLEGRVHLSTDAELVAELRALGGTDTAFLDDEELLAMVLPVTRADYRAVETYRWQPVPPLRCPITALLGADDPRVRREQVAAWTVHTMAGFELHVFPGGHFYLADNGAAAARVVSRSTLSATVNSV